MKTVQTYLLRIIAISLLTSLTGNLATSESVRKVIRFSGSMLFLLAVFSPVWSLDAERLAESIVDMKMQQQIATTGIEVKNKELLEQIIKQQLEAYVLHEAEAQGMELMVNITLDSSGTYPYPTSVLLQGKYTEQQKLYISRVLEDDLSIPPEKQEWIQS